VTDRNAEVIVLAEDLSQFNFTRRYLLQKGYNPHKIHPHLAPPGQGSAEQYVRERYPKEVRLHRSRSSHTGAALVVAVDADIKTVVQRENELETALESAGEHGRGPDEVIVLLIPKRHIETWILCLLGEHVDEVTDYKSRRDVHQQIKPAALTFYEWSRPHYPVPNHCVESLRRGLREVRRIP
jgi:hypothetical protein